MKTALSQFFMVAAIALFGTMVSSAADGWHTSIETAVAEAKKTNKSVMVKFTGSDWCAPCQAIQKKVFSKKEFEDGVKDKFILCVIDSPKANKELAENPPTVNMYEGLTAI